MSIHESSQKSGDRGVCVWGGGRGEGGIVVKEILWSRFLSKCLFTFVKVLMPLNTHPQTPELVCVREPVFRWNLSSTSSVSKNVDSKLLSKHDNLRKILIFLQSLVGFANNSQTKIEQISNKSPSIANITKTSIFRRGSCLSVAIKL